MTTYVLIYQFIKVAMFSIVYEVFLYKKKEFFPNLIKAEMKSGNFIVTLNVIFNIKAFGSKGMNKQKFWNCDNFSYLLLS